MAKTNYSYQKRQKEIARKKKKEEKRSRRAALKDKRIETDENEIVESTAD
jgi:hypothetical protein